MSSFNYHQTIDSIDQTIYNFRTRIFQLNAELYRQTPEIANEIQRLHQQINILREKKKNYFAQPTPIPQPNHYHQTPPKIIATSSIWGLDRGKSIDQIIEENRHRGYEGIKISYPGGCFEYNYLSATPSEAQNLTEEAAPIEWEDHDDMLEYNAYHNIQSFYGDTFF